MTTVVVVVVVVGTSFLRWQLVKQERRRLDGVIRRRTSYHRWIFLPGVFLFLLDSTCGSILPRQISSCATVTPIAFAHWCAYQARIKISGEKLRAKLVATVRTVLQVHQVARILPQVARQGPTRVALPNVNPAIPASTTTYRVKRPWQVAKAVVLASTTIKPVNAGAKSAVQEHSTIKRLQLAAKNVVRASTTRKQINRLSPVVKNAKLAGTTTKRLCLTARNARLASTTTKRLQWVAKNAVRASTTIK